jgi:heat-inducible transcriptional repressor
MTRRDEILKLIVEHFIKTAEPVGSKTLQEVYHLDVSSATIRNEMNALEQDGYLEKTHTSSGRVPSEEGYQYYVSHLRESPVDESTKNALQNVLGEKSKSVEEVMKESCEILSHMTNLASVVLGPSVDEEKLVSVQIIPLGTNTATAVFVTDKGYVENKTFLVDPSLSVEEVVKSVKLLNDRLTGTPISGVVSKMEAMRPALTDYVVGQEIIYDALLEAFAKFATDRLDMYGKDALYNQPEFANDADKLRQLLSLLDDPEKMKKALYESKVTSSSGVNVHIGTKNEGLEDLAIVSASVKLPGDPSACLTVLGPSRMDYEKVVSTLKYFASALDEYFESRTVLKGGKAWQTTLKPQPKASPSAGKTKNKK